METVAMNCRMNYCYNFISPECKSHPYCESCLEFRDEMLAKFTPMVFGIAGDEWRNGIGRRLGDLDDCVQVGMLGLIRTIECFDRSRMYTNKKGVDKPVKFITYAVTSVKRFLHNHCQTNGVIKMSGKSFYEYANKSHVDNGTVITRGVLNPTSLRMSDDECLSIVDDDWQKEIERQLDMDYARTEVFNISKRLPKRELYIVKEISNNEKTLQEVGIEIGVSKERVRQLYNGCMDRLQSYFGVPKTKKRLRGRIKKNDTKPPKPTQVLGVDIAKAVFHE